MEVKIILENTIAKLNTIVEFIGIINRSNDNEMLKLDYALLNIKKEEDESEEEYLGYRDQIGKKYWMVEELKQLAFQLAIIASYRIVELERKKILSVLNNVEEKRLYNYSYVVSILSSYSINENKIRKYDEIEELRLLSNAIKHQGKVTNNLACHGNWVVGDYIELETDIIEKFHEAIPIYIYDLCEKANSVSSVQKSNY